MSTPSSALPTNRLLARLPSSDYQRLQPHLQQVPLKFKQVLYDVGAPICHAFFPLQGVVSLMVLMQDGKAIEVGAIGREGVVGVAVFLGPATSCHQVLVQIAGHALRIQGEVLQQEASADGPLRRLLIGYQHALLAQVGQLAACNGLHPVQQRCCRWLLMNHDRVQRDSYPLTHEFLATMLGVRRSSVSSILAALQEAGLLGSQRGKVIVLNRPRLEAMCCECYQAVNAEYSRLLS